MSLLPYLFDDSVMWRPSRLLDQRFGLALDPEDLLQPLTVSSVLRKCPTGYIRNWRSAIQEQDSGSVVTFDKDKFQANLDVQQFKPEEITVKLTGENTITVEGKHEEKPDEHGHIYRHFIRKYTIPKNCDIARIQSKLSSDGVLTISAPTIENNPIEHKSIPITQTGEPAKVEKKAADNAVEEK